MKRPLIITIGIVIILLVLAVWIYLLLFGTPDESSDVFTNLGFDIDPREVTIVNTNNEDTSSVDVRSGLQQLTTRPVAGFTTVTSASSSAVRYVEQGTGHVYEIDLLNGREIFISRTTLPRVREAVFSIDGERVALISNSSDSNSLYVGRIDEDSQALNGEAWRNIVPNVDNLDFLGTNEVVYTINEAASQVGYTYDMDNVNTDAYIEQFRIPFKDTRVIWRDSETFVYNSPAETLLGYLYDVSNGSYTSTDLNAFNFVADMSDDFIAYSKYEDNQNSSFFIDRTAGTKYNSAIQIIPEKCDFPLFASTAIWCADSLTPSNAASVTDWYQGTVSRSDMLWQLDIPNESATLVANFEEISGRPIDVVDLAVANNDTLILFKNKYDNTLWKYDIK